MYIGFLVFVYFFGFIFCKDRVVQTSLQSSWPFYPLHTEVSEFFGHISSTKFWQYFEQLGSIPNNVTTDKNIYDYSLSKIEEKNILSMKAEYSLLKLAVSLHNYNPAVQMQNQLAKSELLLVGANIDQIKKCNAWILVNGAVSCDINDLEKLLQNVNTGVSGESYPFDHVYPGSATESNTPTVFLYGKLGTEDVWNFHSVLKKNLSKYKYIFRHALLDLSENPDSKKLLLQGYGVDLTLKSVEYKVVDEKEDGGNSEQHEDENVPIKGFDFAKLTENFPTEKTSFLSFKANLRKNEFDIAKIKVWELKGVDRKVAHQISTSANPLKTMKEISQNFPSLMHIIAREKISTDKLDVDRTTILGEAQSHSGYIWVNNIAYAANSISPYKVYASIEKQVNGLASFIRECEVKNDPSLYSLITPNAKQDVPVALNFESDKIFWTNSFPQSSLKNRLRIPNLYSAVFILDPLNYESLLTLFFANALTSQPTTEDYPYPVRIGYIFQTSSTVGKIFANDFMKWMETKQPLQYFVNRLMQFIQNGRISERYLLLFYRKIAEADEYVENNPEEFKKLSEMNEFLKDRNYNSDKITMLFNGVRTEINGDEIQTTLRDQFYAAREELEAMYDANIINSDIIHPNLNFHEWILEHRKAFQYFNSDIATDAQFVPLYSSNAKEVLKSVNYILSPSALDQTCETTHLIVGDFNNEKAFGVLKQAVQFIQKENVLSRVGYIGKRQSKIGDKLDSILKKEYKPSKYFKKVEEALESFPKKVEKSANEFSSPEVEKFWKSIGLEDDEVAIVTNGRVLKVKNGDADFKFLNVYERTRVFPLLQAIESLKYNVDSDSITSSFLSDKVMQIVSFKNFNEYELPPITIAAPSGFPSFSIESPNAAVKISAVLEPLTGATQRASSLLLFISEHFDIDLKVFFKIKSEETIQLKNYYRYVLEPLEFSEDGSIKQNAIANFHMLPQQRLLTMTINEPASWLVSSYDCPYDLDNIILDNLPSYESILSAVFQLDHILVEGSMYDESTFQPTRGLELILGDKVEPHQQDTLVMTNLGYFQLKANPGVWRVGLAQGTQSRKIYDISRQFRTSDEEEFTTYIMNSFENEKLPLTVKKKVGHESSTLFDQVPVQDKEVTHIFSLASGHLYERFLKIMMLSTRNHTTGPVKFWILSNFLSPSFKKLIPSLAKNFGFEVELVTYKWPSWLRHQTEKQRIIWGYKILFLDVLFPINLTKIIYIDADQTVRADMTELRDIDLEGAPYGYTPFCSGDLKNPLTTGFRFWDSGYWVNHLRGKHYHISALYVVDLNELRRSAHADQLRSSYDALTRDPASLANLDQDLPNYLQDYIPIYSLPPNWLWCETWCTNESLSNAKTIDLCNNPLTKEPKLSMAMSIIPEWVDYDNTIKAFETKRKQEEPKENVEL